MALHTLMQGKDREAVVNGKAMTAASRGVTEHSEGTHGGEGVIISSHASGDTFKKCRHL
ncbi:hypothetical protein SCG7109_BB_00110, partial [Chlamydiales bacterium SCGC AG-110-M15]